MKRTYILESTSEDLRAMIPVSTLTQAARAVRKGRKIAPDTSWLVKLLETDEASGESVLHTLH